MERALSPDLQRDLGVQCAAGQASEDRCHVRGVSTQTDPKVQGHGPRLSKVNLYTLLSLWMELFPQRRPEGSIDHSRRAGVVLVQERRIVGLHSSSAELHAGQVAILKHGPRLAGCELYFSRKPCSTCLKMIINAGVSRISYWPGDPEVSLLVWGGGGGGSRAAQEEAELDAAAAERLKAGSRPHVGVLLQPLASHMQQFAEETAATCDFQESLAAHLPGPALSEQFARQQSRNQEELTRRFLVMDEDEHRDLLGKMGLATLCMEPYFRTLRQRMRDLVRLLASIASSIPHPHDNQAGYGFYLKDGLVSPHDPPPPPQDVIRHCFIQAQILSLRTEDPKVGVGAVIWAQGRSSQCDGTGSLHLVGCGYNAYPVGSEYGEYPQMDDKQEDPQSRKYRYIIHAEQNALTFRSREISEEETSMLFVTKCPCDECVPLIKAAGIRQIYTTDLDSGRSKSDISYLMFEPLQGIQKFIWQRRPQMGGSDSPLSTSPIAIKSSSDKHSFTPIANGSMKHPRSEESQVLPNKRLRP